MTVHELPSTSSQTPGISSQTPAIRPRRSFQTNIAGTMKLKELPSKKLKRIETLLVGTVAEGYLPFALVENKKLVELIKELEPRYSLHSRKTFTNKYVVDRYAELKQIISTSLDSSNYVAITADMWTCLATQGYLSVTLLQLTTLS